MTKNFSSFLTKYPGSPFIGAKQSPPQLCCNVFQPLKMTALPAIITVLFPLRLCRYPIQISCSHSSHTPLSSQVSPHDHDSSGSPVDQDCENPAPTVRKAPHGSAPEDQTSVRIPGPRRLLLSSRSLCEALPPARTCTHIPEPHNANVSAGSPQIPQADPTPSHPV